MANALDSIAPKILARGMLAFRDQAFFPRIVNQEFSAEAARKGDTIDIMLPGTVNVEDVEPGSAPNTPSDVTVKTYPLKMDNWKKVSFHLTDKELMQVDANQDFVPFQMQEAVAALATEINNSFMAKITKANHAIGMFNQLLFSQDENHAGKTFYKTAPAIESRKLLNIAKAPRSGRYAVIGYDDESMAVTLPEFADADRSHDAAVVTEGMIGRKYGFDWYSTDPLFRHEASANRNVRMKEIVPVGSTDLTFTLASNNAKAGDVIVSNSDKVIGIIDEDSEKKSNKELSIKLKSPTVDPYRSNEIVQIAGTHDNGLAFQRNAFAFAMRPLAAASQDYGLGNRILSVTDPVSGLSLRLEISRQYKQTVWEFDALWGVEMIHPEFAVRLLTKI